MIGIGEEGTILQRYNFGASGCSSCRAMGMEHCFAPYLDAVDRGWLAQTLGDVAGFEAIRTALKVAEEAGLGSLQFDRSRLELLVAREAARLGLTV